MASQWGILAGAKTFHHAIDSAFRAQRRRGFQHFNPAESWFPDAFGATMGQLLIALETGQAPAISGRDNLK